MLCIDAIISADGCISLSLINLIQRGGRERKRERESRVLFTRELSITLVVK